MQAISSIDQEKSPSGPEHRPCRPRHNQPRTPYPSPAGTAATRPARPPSNPTKKPPPPANRARISVISRQRKRRSFASAVLVSPVSKHEPNQPASGHLLSTASTKETGTFARPPPPTWRHVYAKRNSPRRCQMEPQPYALSFESHGATGNNQP